MTKPPIALCVLIALAVSACNAQEIPGTYHAAVMFAGKDPRYVGQKYDWRLTLEKNGTFVFSFELPMAIYLEDGAEKVGKASSLVSGDWSRTEKGLLLNRKKGEGSLGSTDTMSFSFDKNSVTLQVVAAGVKLQEGTKSLELKRIPNRLPVTD